MDTIPEGFAPHVRKSPVTDPWEPLYARRGPERVELGVRLARAHCNSRGFIHGGVIAALADNAMGLSLGAALEARDAKPAGGAVTVGLSVDYVGAGQIGQWLTVSPRVVKTGRTIGFVDALITADEEVIARANATFRVLA
jgi:uncharacterized protein (TIGR00369 family)